VSASSYYLSGSPAVFEYASGSSVDDNVFLGFAGQKTNQTFGDSGDNNTAVGYQALNVNGEGYTGGFVAFGNTATGAAALFDNTLGNDNTATGYDALYSNTTGSYNIAIGYQAGSAYTGGENNNIDVGNNGIASESGIIHIGTVGTQTATYVAGIGTTTMASGSAVFVNTSTGQLGIMTSSQRFKENIVDMGDESNLLMKLRPVAFYYKPELDPTHTRQYGLVAEEVAQVAPQLVVFDKDGTPQTVRYHFVNAMLLNEVQKQRQLIEEQQKASEDQQGTIARQQAEIQDLANRLAKLEARLAPAQ